jgi:RNA polymerase sigma factor (sigma-70 family)
MSEGTSILTALDEDELLRHVRFVQALARELVGGDVHAADEIAQETWTRALAFAPRSAGKLRAWLATIVRHTASKLARGERRRVRHERTAIAGAPAPASVEVAARMEAHQRVVRAVLALPEPYHTTVVLRYFSGLAPRAIAREQGVPLETVRSRLKRAIELLRHDLDRSCGDRAVWLAALAPLARTPLAGPALLVSLVTLMTSTTKIVLAGVAALALTGGAWLWLGSRSTHEEGSARHSERTSGSDDASGDPSLAPAAPEKAPASPREELAGASDADAPNDASLHVRGRLEVLDGRTPVNLPLTIFLGGPVDAADEMLHLHEVVEFVSEQQAEVMAGEPYTIPVPRAGMYPARAGSPRASNQVWVMSHSTSSLAKQSLALARTITVRLTGSVPADLVMRPSYLGDGGYQDGDAMTRNDAGAWTLAGPVLLPLRVTLTSAAWPEPWHLTCVTPDVSATVPALSRAVLVRDAETHRPISRAQLLLTSMVIVHGFGHPFWCLALATDPDGLVTIRDRGALRFESLEAVADGYQRFSIRSPERLSKNDQGLPVIDLVRATQERCRLVDSGNRAVGAAQIVVLDEDGSSTGVAGGTSADGSFFLASHNHAAWPPSPAHDPLLLVVESDRTASVLGPAPLADLCAGRWVGVLAGPRVELRAELVDEASGAPVRGRACLFATAGGYEGVPLSGWLRAGVQGRAALRLVRGGPWMIRGQAEGFVPASVVATPSANGIVRVAMHRIVDHIAVRVVDAQGAPRADVGVCIVDPDQFHTYDEATTDRDGRATVGVPAPGEYACYLAIAPDGRELESVSNPGRVTVGTGEVLFRIVPSVVVTFDLRFADGTVPDPAQVVVRGPGGRRFATGWGWSATTPECTLPDEPCTIEIIANGARNVTMPFPGTWDREAPIQVTLERE